MAVLAHDPHPTGDNMCGSPGYGECTSESQWKEGWYRFLCHSNNPRCFKTVKTYTPYVENSDGNWVRATPAPDNSNVFRTYAAEHNHEHLAWSPYRPENVVDFTPTPYATAIPYVGPTEEPRDANTCYVQKVKVQEEVCSGGTCTMQEVTHQRCISRSTFCNLNKYNRYWCYGVWED